MGDIMKKSQIWLTVILLSACALLLAMWASPSALADRPPRWPTPQPTATPAPLPNDAIELTVTSAPKDLWTVVQWQDALGDWHDVGGWQGTLDAGDTKTWWVAREDYGKGPFRWALAQDGELLAASESFYLPDSDGQIVKVLMTLEP